MINKDENKNMIHIKEKVEPKLLTSLERAKIKANKLPAELKKLFSGDNIFKDKWQKRISDGHYNNIEPIDVMVLTYNRLEYLKRCIYSIWCNTIYPFRLIVVNNGSPNIKIFLNKLKKVLDDKGYIEGKHYCFYNLEKNIGTAKGKNFGIGKCDSRFFAISDDDAWYNPEWLMRGIEIMSVYETAGIVSLFHQAEPFPQRTRNELGIDNKEEIRVVYRASITPMHWIIRKSILDKTGLFQERRGRKMGYSGTGFMRKMFHAGYQIVNIQNRKNRYGQLFVTSMDRSSSELNLIEHYLDSGYNSFRSLQKNGRITTKEENILKTLEEKLDKE